MLDVARTAGPQPAAKSFFGAFDPAFIAEISRKMRAADHARIAGEASRTLKRSGDAQRIKGRCHLPCAIGAAGARCRQSGLQGTVSGIDAKTDNVDGFSLPGYGYFDAVNKPDPVLACSGGCCRQPGGIIMIGQCKHIDAAPRRPRNQRRRRDRAVGHRRMTMQIRIIQ